MFSRSRARIQLPPIFAIPLGLLISAGGVWFIYDNLAFRMVAVPTIGHVDSVSTSGIGTKRSTRAQVSFEDHGQRRNATITGFHGASGDDVAMLYDPNDPSDARQNTTATFNILVGLLFVGMGLFAAGSGALRPADPNG